MWHGHKGKGKGMGMGPPPEPFLVLGRYEVHPYDVLGKGGFSIVRRGRDVVTGEIVAVKAFTEMEHLDLRDPDYHRKHDFFMKKFEDEIQIFKDLHTQQDLRNQVLKQKETARGKRMSWFIPAGLGCERTGCELIDVFDDFPDTGELFIRLIDYSKDETGRPAPAKNGVCYVVLELAEYTLAEYLFFRQQTRRPLPAEEIFEIFKQLARIIAALHAKDFVHCDLKPLNVMRFPSGRWKLIDLDGVVIAGRPTQTYAIPRCISHQSLQQVWSETFLG